MTISTSNSYTGDGETRLFPFTFPYTTVSSIKVSVDETMQTPVTDYILANATTISFVEAPPTDSVIFIYRETNIEDIQSTFFPGSAIRASDLNNNFTQNLYLIQEKNPQRPGGPIDMAFHKIVRLDDPVNPRDAVNLRTLEAKLQEIRDLL